MSMKSYVWLGVFIGSTIGGILGAFLDNGNPFGLYGLVFGTIGGIVGIWAAYKLYNS